MAANAVAIDIHDHGVSLDGLKGRIRCNYCGKVVSGYSRLTCHLAGIRGDVAPCERVPTNVKDMMRSQLVEKKRGSLTKEVGELYHPNLPLKRHWCSHPNVFEDGKPERIQPTDSRRENHVEVNSLSNNSVLDVDSFPKTKRRMCSQAAAVSVDDLSSQKTMRCIGRFFYETGLDFDAVKSPSFQSMLSSVLGSGQTVVRIPSYQELRGRILKDEVEEMRHYVQEIRNSWARTGCSVLLDGWIDGKGRNLINIIVDCPKGPVYLKSLDISSALGNADTLQQLFDEVIQQVGSSNVVQIMSYATSAFVELEAAARQLMEKHRSCFWTVSASHCLELMLEKMGMMGLIKGTLNNAKTITKFIYSRATILKLMRNHTHGSNLVKPSKSRSAMPFLTLENIVSEKENLMKMFISSEFVNSVWASSREGRRVADLVADDSFWTEAVVVLKATIPLVRVLHWINKFSEPHLGYIYETIDQAKEAIKGEFKNKKAQYMPFWRAIDEIWNNHLHSPLHSAGYFLNPSLFYSSDFFTDAEVASGLLCCIVRMVEGRHDQDLVSLQVDEYRAARGSFGEGSAIDRRSSVSPAVWWSQYGGQCPELQRLAIQILSQTCDGASRYHLKRGLAEKLLTEGRNHIEQQRFNDMAFVHYNLQLQKFESGGSREIEVEEIDPMDDWIVDETLEVELAPQHSELLMTWRELECGDEAVRKGYSSGEGSSSFHPKEEPKSCIF